MSAVNPPSVSVRAAGFVAWIRRMAPLLLALILLVDTGLGVYRDQRSLSFPQDTHHESYGALVRLARVMEGWSPIQPLCSVSYFCPAGFDAPTPTAMSWVERTRWIWYQGDDYINAFPLHALPAAILVVLFPGSAAVAALGLRFWFALLAMACYRLGKLGRGPLTGLFAAVLACGTPAFVGAAISHVDAVPLAAIAAWMSLLLLVGDGFANVGSCIGVALLALVAFRVAENTSGTLNVAQVALLPGWIAIETSLRRAWRGDRPWRRLLGFVVIVAPVLLVAGLWSGRGAAIEYMSFGAKLGDKGVPGAADGNWLPDHAVLPRQFAYVEECATHLVLFPLVALLWVGLAASLRPLTRERVALVGMHALPLLVLSSSVRIGNWYLIPSLTGLVVGGAVGLTSIRRPLLRGLLCTAALGAAVVERLEVVFASGPHWQDDALVRPVIQGDPLLQFPRPAYGAAMHAVADVVRGAGSDGPPLRVLMLSFLPPQGYSKKLALEGCWLIELEVPNSTCYSPIFENSQYQPMELLDPSRYDFLVWFEREGLREVPLGTSDGLPDPLTGPLRELGTQDRAVAEPLLRGLVQLRWERVQTPAGPVYRRLR